MKKLFLSMFVIFLFSINAFVMADCNNDELNEWATSVKGEFVENNKSDSALFNFAYFISITPLRDDVKIKVIDSTGNSGWGETYSGSYTNVYGVGCFTNLDAEKYKIEVYGDTNSACPNKLLKTLEITVPRFNEMSKDQKCKDYPDFELCETFTNKTEFMSDAEFKEKLKEYANEENNDSLLIKVFNIIKEYILYIIIPFIIVSIIYVLRVKVYKTKGGRHEK